MAWGRSGMAVAHGMEHGMEHGMGHGMAWLVQAFQVAHVMHMSCTCHHDLGDEPCGLMWGLPAHSAHWAKFQLLSTPFLLDSCPKKGLRRAPLSRSLAELQGDLHDVSATPLWFQPVHFSFDRCITGSFSRSCLFVFSLRTRGTPNRML